MRKVQDYPVLYDRVLLSRNVAIKEHRDVQIELTVVKEFVNCNCSNKINFIFSCALV